MSKSSVMIGALLLVALGTNAWGFESYANYNHIFVKLFNDARYTDDATTYNFAGASNYDPAYANKVYYIKSDGGGLNALHVTNSLSALSGQNTTINTTDGTASGTFYITDTGGKGYDDDVILMVSVKPDANGNIPSNLSISVTPTGPVFPQSTPSSAQTATQPTVTIGAGDFLYDKLAYKPGPGTGWALPLYASYSNQEYQVWIDLKVGTVGTSQNVSVAYTISGLTTHATFNAYSWMKTSNQGEGISWTQNTSGTSGTSGFAINKQ